MIRALFILLIGLAAGSLAFFYIRQQTPASVTAAFIHDGNSRLPELQWLKVKLQLTDEQFAKVAEVHADYRPTCEALCMKVVASHAKIESLASASHPVSPALEQALTEHALLHVECQKAMLNHLHRTASFMTAEQAETYLEALLPQVIELPLEPGSGAHGHQ